MFLSFFFFFRRATFFFLYYVDKKHLYKYKCIISCLYIAPTHLFQIVFLIKVFHTMCYDGPLGDLGPLGLL